MGYYRGATEISAKDSKPQPGSRLPAERHGARIPCCVCNIETLRRALWGTHFMKIVIALNFIVLALIMTGLFFVSKANYRALNQSSRNWSIAVLCDASGMALLGGMFMMMQNFHDHTFWGTVSNTLLFAALIYQTLSIHALNADITLPKRQLAIASIVLFGIGWNHIRTRMEVNDKVLIFAGVALAILFWQVYEISKRPEKSNQLRIIFWSITGEIVFTVLRFFAISAYETTIVQIEDLPLLGVFSLWFQYGLKIVAYAALVGYWSENLATQKAKTELENEQFKQLSTQQEKLIADLGRLNKAATAGVVAASIAHELSQPLQGVLLDSSIGLEEVNHPQPNLEVLRSTLQAQLDNAKRMAQIVNTMRGMFTESGASDESIDLFELIQNLGLLITPQAQKMGIQLVYDHQGSSVVRVKATEIQQVLLNLINNAFEAVQENTRGTALVQVSCASEGEWVVCKVEDSGPGIAGMDHADVFKFLKTTKSNGMGLGLWLSKYIVERNKGDISVGHSALGGAMFVIKLPAA